MQSNLNNSIGCKFLPHTPRVRNLVITRLHALTPMTGARHTQTPVPNSKLHSAPETPFCTRNCARFSIARCKKSPENLDSSRPHRLILQVLGHTRPRAHTNIRTYTEAHTINQVTF